MGPYFCIKQLLKQIEPAFLPFHCILCQRASDQPHDICTQCADLIFHTKTSTCELCSSILYGNFDTPVCGNCLKHPPYYNHLFCLGPYESHLARLISQLKFHQQLSVSKILGELMIKKLNGQSKPDLIIPVPLHKKRLSQRGFNQAVEIAKPIARYLRIPMDITSCQRIRHTEPQTQVDAKYRRSNIKNAFHCDFTQPPESVAIVDDVFTTGNTVNELSRLLKQSGVTHIDIWCAAKTPLKRKG